MSRDRQRPRRLGGTSGPTESPKGTGDSTTVTEEIPTAEVLEIQTPRRGNRTVVVRCPFCGCRHVHGWPASDGNTLSTSRVSHCRQDARTYRLKASLP